MAAGDIWILGSNMTKFGKHPDEDIVDLASQAAMAALADGGVTMADVGVMGVGNLMAAGAGIGQQLQKQVGQTGIPVFNVANACATGATALRVAIMAIKAGETDVGLAVGVEKLAGAGLLGQGPAKPASDTWEPSGRYGALGSTEGRIGTGIMPGVFAQVGMEYGHKYGGTSFELFARISEKNRAFHAQPARCLPEALHSRRDHERRHGCVSQHAADVLGQLRRRRGHGRRVRRVPQEPSGRAAEAGGEDRCVGAHHRSVAGGLPGPARRQHPDPQRRHPGLRDGRRRPRGPRPRRAPRLLRHRRAGALRQPDAVPRGGAVDFFESGAPWRDGDKPVNVSGGLQSKGHPIAATGIANIHEIVMHLRGEAGDRQIEGAKVGLAHVIGLGSACGVHILEKAA